MNPLWSQIYQLLWRTMIPVISDHWLWSRSSQRNASLKYAKRSSFLEICFRTFDQKRFAKAKIRKNYFFIFDVSDSSWRHYQEKNKYMEVNILSRLQLKINTFYINELKIMFTSSVISECFLFVWFPASNPWSNQAHQEWVEIKKLVQGVVHYSETVGNKPTWKIRRHRFIYGRYWPSMRSRYEWSSVAVFWVILASYKIMFELKEAWK